MILPFIIFWVFIILIWIDYGPKIPLIFISLWLAGLIIFIHFNISSYLFITYQAILAAVLLVIKKCKDALL